MFVVCTKLANLIEKSIERQRLVWRGRGRGPSIITVSAPPQIEAARVTEIQIETAETIADSCSSLGAELMFPDDLIVIFISN